MSNKKRRKINQPNKSLEKKRARWLIFSRPIINYALSGTGPDYPLTGQRCPLPPSLPPSDNGPDRMGLIRKNARLDPFRPLYERKPGHISPWNLTNLGRDGTPLKNSWAVMWRGGAQPADKRRRKREEWWYYETFRAEISRAEVGIGEKNTDLSEAGLIAREADLRAVLPTFDGTLVPDYESFYCKRFYLAEFSSRNFWWFLFLVSSF